MWDCIQTQRTSFYLHAEPPPPPLEDYGGQLQEAEFVL